MRELVEQIVNHLISMWRFRWLGLALAWVLSVAGCIFIFMLPNIYKANAIIYVDADSSLIPLLRGLAVDKDPYGELGVITEALLSRPNLTEVARVARLGENIESAGDFEELLMEMRLRIKIATLRAKQNLFEISYTDSDRETARVVVYELLNAFMSNTLGFDNEDSNSAEKFLDEQIAEYEVRMAEAERRLAEFKREHVGQMPGESGDYYERLQRGLDAVAAIEARLEVAVDRRDELARQLAGEDPSVGMGIGTAPTGIQTELDARIAQLKSQRDELMRRYTANHPDVLYIQQTLNELEKEREAQRPLFASLGLGNAGEGGANAVYQDLRINLNKAEVSVAEYKARLRNQNQSVQELKNLVGTLPDIEAQLVQLNRDYNVTGQHYTELLNRREAARLTRDAGFTEMGAQFKIIEPTKALTDPVGPERPLLMLALMIGSLGASLALAFFLSQIKPICSSVTVLQRLTGRPVLGPIVSIFSPAEARRIKLQRFTFFVLAGLLIVTYMVSIAMEESLSSGLRSVASVTSESLSRPS